MVVSIPDSTIVMEDTNFDIQVCAMLTSMLAIERNITIDLGTISVNSSSQTMLAWDYFDFEPVQSRETFTFGSINGDKKCITVTLLNDSIPEDNQTISVILTSPEINVVLKPNLTIITIIDDDG